MNDANQSGLVAWHHYKTRAFREALDWFKLALDRGGDAMIAHGLAHSLRELGMNLEAEEVAYAWREPLINNAVLFIDVLERDLTKPLPPYIEPGRLLRYAQVTMDLAAGEGAQALGWYAYNTCQFEASYEWFQRAAAWFPKEATVYGLALSARRLKKQKELFELANRYDGLFPKVLDILFPDGFQRPPSACDLAASGATARKGAAPGGAPVASVQNSAWAAAAAPGSSAARHPGWGGAGVAPATGFAQQGFGQQAYGQQAYGSPAGYNAPLAPVAHDRMPQFTRTEFPAAVDPENPLRFASSGKTVGRAANVTHITMQNTPLSQEPWRNPQPLVANRVPGVSSMPYERWGFSLLPGGNGLQNADTPHSALQAPAGTLWASEQTSGSAANQVGGAGAQADPYALLQAIAGAGKAPLPSVVRGGGQSFMRSSSLSGEEADPLGASELRPSFAATEADFAPTGSTDPVEQLSPALPVAPETLVPPTPATPAAPEEAAEGEISTHSRAEPEKDDLRVTAVRLYEARQYEAALAALDRRAATMPETFDLRLVRGWSLINLKREAEARGVFAGLGDNQAPDEPSTSGRSR